MTFSNILEQPDLYKTISVCIHVALIENRGHKKKTMRTQFYLFLIQLIRAQYLGDGLDCNLDSLVAQVNCDAGGFSVSLFELIKKKRLSRIKGCKFVVR